MLKNNEKQSNHSAMEYKSFPFQILETKSNFTGGKPYGIVKGYASTYGNVERCNDIILEVSFIDSIQDYKNKSRQVKVYHQHDVYSSPPIGGIRPENIESDKTGLPVTIELNQDVQLGKEVYALLKQGVYSDMSIGYTVDPDGYEYNKDGIRLLKKLTLWEVSIVGEPANEMAKISEVKSRDKFKFFTITDLKNITSKREFEDVLRESGAFSKEATTFLAAHFVEKARRESDSSCDDKQLLNSIKELQKA